jgi:hypothetical protein
VAEGEFWDAERRGEPVRGADDDGGATLKQQRRNVLEYLTAVCEAALWGEKAPSLLPTS